jgi:hypothetical protein
MRKRGEGRTTAGGFMQVVAYGNIELENQLNTIKTVPVLDTML